MRKVALAIFLIFLNGTALAQTYACQFIMTAGMHKDSRDWSVTEFKNGEPFFIKIVNGLIDASLLNKRPISISDGVCREKFGIFHTCSDFSNYLTFDNSTMNGGLAKVFGATQSQNDKGADSVLVARFTCQKVG